MSEKPQHFQEIRKDCCLKISMCLKFCNTEKVLLDKKEIIIRRPEDKDLDSLLDFINSITDNDVMNYPLRKI
jgi:hypothetical protein